MRDNLEFLIPVIISIIAIVFTGMQQNIANKQFLFDKRLYLYQLYRILLKHQKEVETDFQDNSADYFCIDAELIYYLTCDSILDTDIVGWKAGKFGINIENQKSFLAMLEKLRSYGVESSFIFSGKNGQNLCKYFDKYAKLCLQTYKNSSYLDGLKLNTAMPLVLLIEEQRPLHNELKEIYTDLCKLSESIKLSDLEKSISFIRRTKYENNKKLGNNS